MKRMRKFIFDHFFTRSSPPVLEEAMGELGLDRAKAFSEFKALEDDHHILLVPGTQRILMANPYSAVTTPFRVKSGGRWYYANCAWDTVSMHVMLDADAEIESYCHHCAEPVRLTLSRGRVRKSEPSSPLIFLSVPVARWYDNLINTCSNNMVYFSSEAHRDEWLSAYPGLAGVSLSVERMAEVCQPLSRGRMELDYERPTKEALGAYWASIGLTGDYWKI
jgi:Alkylmercury lyase